MPSAIRYSGAIVQRGTKATKRARAYATACPQPEEADIRPLDGNSRFDPGCVKTRRCGEQIEWTFRQITIRVMRIFKRGQFRSIRERSFLGFSHSLGVMNRPIGHVTVGSAYVQ